MQPSLIEVMDSNSLIRIRNLVAGNKLIGQKSLDDISQLTEISTFESSIVLVPTVQLKNSGKGNAFDDVENVKLIRAALPNLTARLATDERIWVTLALGHFYLYSKERWLNNQPSHVTDKYFVNHVLSASSRSRWRDQSISRLWWVGNYAESLGSDIENRAIELFFFNSDLGSQLLGKPSIATSKPIARSIVSIAHREFISEKSSSWNRNKFRDFMKEIDLLTGRRILEVVPESQLDAEVQAIFSRCYDE